MIQRLQTLLLSLAAVSNLMVLFFPIWIAFNNNEVDGSAIDVTAYATRVEHSVSAMDIDNAFNESTISFSENIFLTILMFLVISVSVYLLVVVFLYNNRGRQMQLAYAGMVAICAQFLLLIPIRSWLEDMVGTPGMDFQSVPQYGMGFAIVALLLTWWAAKRIRKDERMVRDMDRIR